ncbi:MAG: hypothetical protein QOG85_852 [Gaiellaceae bacterium]|jgi:hypothetical protein|nr:hypothetical protein [Gaiellaceae bacterium]
MVGRLVRARRPRTPQTPVHEALGRALGAWALSDEAFRQALLAGFTDALRAHTLGGKRFEPADAAAELGAVGEKLAAAHCITARKRRRRRRRPAC